MGKSDISIKKNMLLMLTYRTFVTVTPLITTPYICRVLSPEGLGEYGYTQSICAYFGTLAALGTTMYAQREIAFIRDDREKMSILFWEILGFRTVTKVISIFIYTILSNWVFSPDLKVLFLIQIMDLTGGLLDISWLYIGIEQFSKVFAKNAVLKFISIACIFLFVKEETDLYLYVLINSIAILTSNGAFWIGIQKYVNRVPFSKLHFKKHIPATITLFLPSVASVIYNKVDTTMLGLISEKTADVAYYQQTLKISTICTTTISTVGGVIAPRLAYAFSNLGREELRSYFMKGLNAILLIGTPISFGLFSIADSFIPMFLGDKYMTTIDYLKLMSPLSLIAGVNAYIGAQYLVTTKRQKQYTALIIFGTIINIICNAAMIGKLGGIGAIVASLVSEFTILVAGLWLLSRDFRLLDLVRVIPQKLIPGIMMCGIVLLMESKLSISVVHVAIEIVTGAAVYFLLLILMHDTMILDICRALAGRIKRKSNN